MFRLLPFRVKEARSLPGQVIWEPWTREDVASSAFSWSYRALAAAPVQQCTEGYRDQAVSCSKPPHDGGYSGFQAVLPWRSHTIATAEERWLHLLDTETRPV